MLAAETRLVAVPYATGSPPKYSTNWNEILETADPFLKAVAKRLVAQAEEFEPAVVPHAQYALSGHGKQLRPLLVSLSGSAVGKVSDPHVTVAAIIEMVHLATLVHDDIIDEATLRRGRPTLSANWGNEISVLLGDCLFAHALKLAASFPTPDICRAVASATNTVCSGEILQTQCRRKFHLSREEYFKILAMKTAELFALSCELGGLLSHASPAYRETLRHYGLALGTAYQLYDDCLDVFGSETAAGKTLGNDLANGEVTLPLLIAMERMTDAERVEVEAQVRNWVPENFARIMISLETYDVLTESRRIIHQYLAAARQTLLLLPASEGRNGLSGLLDYLSQQSDALGV
ncbi:MAG: polyprenyl synthetase family protein [Verrucomicrobiota bacterium]